MFTVQHYWRRRYVQCSAELEVKRYPLFSRVGREKMYNVQQGWRRRDVQCSAGLEKKFTV